MIQRDRARGTSMIVPARPKEWVMDFTERVAGLMAQLTVAEKIQLLHQHQAPVERLGMGPFRTGTEALHGLAWLGEATVFPQAVALGATWDPDLVRRVGSAVADEVRARHHKDPAEAGLNVWAPVVNPLRDPRWGRNEEGYSEDAWLTGLLGQAYAQGLRGDDPRYLKTAPTLKHFLGYNNETDRCVSSSNLPARVLHEYEFPAYRPAIASGAAVAVMASYNLVNGRPAHVTPHINGDLRSWTGDEVFVVSDAYAPSNLADPAQQAYFPDHAASHAASLRAGIDSFTDADDRSHVTVARLAEALERGLIGEADLDLAVRRALLLRMRLGEFDPVEGNVFASAQPDLDGHAALAREAARRAVVVLKRDRGLLPMNPVTAGRVAVVGPLADQLMTDWYSGTMAYQVTVRDGLTARLGPERVLSVEGVDRIALRRIGGGYLSAMGGAVRGTPDDAYGFDVFDWGRGGVLALRAASDGRYLTVREGRLAHDSPGPHGWEVHETFRLIEHGEAGFLLRHELTGLAVGFAPDGSAVLSETGLEVFEMESRVDGVAQAASLAAQADVAVVVLGNHPLVNGRETEDRLDLALPQAQDRLLRAVFEANPRTVLLLNSSYPYALGWADAALPGILWSGHGGQEHGHAVAEVLLGEADPAGRLPQTWYHDHGELPDLFDYDIITNDATYLYYRGLPLYPFGHGLSWTEFAYRELRLSHDSAGAGDRIVVSVEVANVGDRAGEEVVQLYTRQMTSRVKQPLRQLRAFSRIALAAGEKRTVTLEFDVAVLAHWDVTSGRFAVESAGHKVMIGRSATDIRLCATLAVTGETIGPRRADLVRANDFDEYSGIALVPAGLTEGDAVTGAEPGAWVYFGLTDLTSRASATLTLAGPAGRLTLRDGDPLDGPVLAEWDFAGGPRFEPAELSTSLREPVLTELYLVWETPGAVVSAVGFA